MENYHQESFGNGVVTVDEQLTISDTVPDETTMSRVEFVDSSVQADCRQTDSILAVAKAAGLIIPSGCTMGICGTSKVRKVSGNFHMVHNGDISEKEIEHGYILACCSNPIEAVSIAV